MRERLLLAGLFVATALGLACSESSGTGATDGQGTLAVRLTDHPFWIDSVAAVNVFVVRIDARVAEADSAEADSALDEHHEAAEHDDHGGSRMDADSAEDHDGDHDRRWVTIATPNVTFNLLDLQNGVTAFLGETPIDTGDFRAIRLVIDPSRSSIVLKNGTVLSGDASPFTRFHDGRLIGIRIDLNDPIRIRVHHRTELVIDFDLENSFALAGVNVHGGFLFTPVLHCTQR